MRALVLALALVGTAAAQEPSAAQLSAQAYDHFYNLEFDDAIQEFQRAIALDPKSPDLHNHLAETIVFREMFRDGALESELVSGNNSFLRRPKLNPSPETEKWFLDELARAMALSDARLRANPNDVGALYAEGISYGLRSDYYWIVKKAWVDSLKAANAARRMHNRVSELEPNDVDARLVQGLHDYIVGSLPLMFRMLGFMAGVHGNKERGIHEVQDVAEHGKEDRVDAQILLCALYRRENEPRNAIPLVQDLIRRYPRNFLLRMELAQMYSVAGDGQSALGVLRDVAAMKTGHAAGFDRLPWEKIYFQQGTIEFWYRQFDAALDDLKKVTAAPADVDLNTGAYAYLRIGQIYDMTNRRAMALTFYNKAIQFAPDAEAAQEARKYLSSPYRRG
ncbi:MAG TPA: tetratricopeptide repeat protein [Bryobacteraceae bacterium]|nr:tetratricopeptide repeat protein [Bryobacteraceae bacterium]